MEVEELVGGGAAMIVGYLGGKRVRRNRGLSRQAKREVEAEVLR